MGKWNRFERMSASIIQTGQGCDHRRVTHSRKEDAMMKTSRTAKNTPASKWLASIRCLLLVTVLVSLALNNRERILDKVRVWNKRFLNPRTLKIAGRKNSPYVLLQHVGRRSGKAYMTPVVADYAQSWEGFLIPLPYGVHTDWCRNVLAAGRCTIIKDQVLYHAIEPTLIDAVEAFPELPVPVRATFRAFGVKKFLKVWTREPASLKNQAGLTAAEKAVETAH